MHRLNEKFVRVASVQPLLHNRRVELATFVVSIAARIGTVSTLIVQQLASIVCNNRTQHISRSEN